MPITISSPLDTTVPYAGLRSLRRKQNSTSLSRSSSCTRGWEKGNRSERHHPHSHTRSRHLRRTCAKFCRKAGGAIEQVQQLLGHEDLSTTAVYLGTTQDIRQAVNDRIAL